VTTAAAPSDLDRRSATVLFVDILGATELSARAGIEQAYAIVTGCARVLEGVARRHGGVVDKYLSDCLMAVFGVPIPSAQAPAAAVAAAVEMFEAAARYGTEVASPIPLTLRIGINTGDMIAGDLRGPVVREFAVMGDAVNVAARLKDIGEPGAIHVGPTTHDAARAHFVFEPAGSLVLRGKTAPVHAFRAVPPVPGARRARGGPPPLIDTPLLGRAHEMSVLRTALADASAGRGRSVVVLGDEGAGKSRLVTEICTEAAARGVSVFAGHAVLAHRDAAFHVIGDLVADWAGIGIADGPEIMRAKLADTARDFPGFDAVGLGDALLSSAPNTATLSRALVAALEALIVRGPLVIACEDLQWADDASIELIARLTRWSLDRPVLWVLTARPPAGVLEAALGERHDVIALRPLAPDDATELLNHVAAGSMLSDVARRRILHRAGGNAYRVILGGLLAGAVETEVAHETATVERAADTERRRVTVLFADITGFTRMSERLPPTETYRAVNGCLAILHEVATKHGGSVEKYLGDCIMAVFGAPIAIEDAPRAAVNAAIEMRRRVREYNRTAALPTPLDIHVGINTGLGIAGDVSGPLLREFTLMGDAVSFASKLKDIAPAGRVWVGAETHRATRTHFSYEPATIDGPQPEGPRGRRARPAPAVTAWELRSERQRLHRDRAADGGRTLFSAMVGRDVELARLREQLGRAAGGTGAIVTIVAEAGLGKSRLVLETKGLPEAAPLRFLEARSISAGGALPYHPFVDLLRSWASIDDEDSEHVADEKLRRLLDELLTDRMAEHLPFVARLMGLPLTAEQEARLAGIDAEGMEKLIARSVRELFVAASRSRPLVVCFEDLHWADVSSLQLLLGLLPLAREHAIIFVLAARPHYETSRRVLEACRDRLATLHVGITLERLGERDCALLLRNLIRYDDRSQTTRSLVLSRADGNPFFIEEVVRALIDAGAIERTPDGLRVTARIDEVHVPNTIQEVMMARVDRLPPAQREILQLGSVIGRTFAARLLTEVAERRDAVGEALAELVDRDLLEASVAGGEPGFAFKHALAQETIYQSILETTRRRLHADVAVTIERIFVDRLADYYGMLAYHFGRAESLEKATDYLMKAGDVAERIAASSEALSYFSEAARLYDVLHGDAADPQIKAFLEKRIGLAYLNKGDLPAALDRFDRALAHLGERDPATVARTARRLAGDVGAVLFHVYLRGGRPRVAPPDARTRELIDIIFHKGKAQSTSAPQGYVLSMLRGIRRLGAVDPQGIEQACGIYGACAALFAFSGLSFDLSARFLRMSKALVRNVRDELGYRTMAFLHHYLAGDWSEEHTIDGALIAEGLRHGAFWEINTYLGLDCERRICQGRFDEARALIARLARIGDEYGYGFVRSNEYFMTAYLALQERDLPAASAALNLYYGERSEQALNLLALGTRCEIETLQGDLAAATASSLEAEEIRVRLGRQAAPYHSAPQYLGRWLLALESWESGHDARPTRRHVSRLARSALGIARSIARERPRALRLMARQSWLFGRRRAAVRWWNRGIRESERLGARPELARICAEAAARLGETSVRVRGLDASSLAARASTIADDLRGPRDDDRRTAILQRSA
jgi:class 3 adenylate cyclase/predicted ATPase